MPSPNDRESWLDTNGRMARKRLLIRGVPLLVVGTLVYLGIAEMTARSAGTSLFAGDPASAATVARIEGMAGAIVVAVAAWPAAALIIRRLHDIGLSGWWLALMASGEVVNSVALATGLAGAPPALTPVGQFATLLALAGGLSFIPLALWPGQATANRYGPPPAD